MKKLIMILGVQHLDNPNNGDVFAYDSGNIKSTKKQLEIDEVIKGLKKYNPTNIALEIEKEHEELVNNDFKKYSSNLFELSSNEKHQIGFKLAKELNLDEVNCINWNKSQPHVPFLFQWVEETKNPVWFEMKRESEIRVKELQDYLSKHTIRDFLLKINDVDFSKKDHQFYMKLALLGDSMEDVGAKWVAQYWYYRNIRLYNNLNELYQTGEERVLLIIGAAHVYLLKQFLSENGDYEIEEVYPYLT